MKRTIKSLAVALALLVGISACTKETPAGENETRGTGKLEITFGLDADKNDPNLSRAAQSSKVVPGTSWNNNIKHMMLIMATGGNIAYAQPINVPNWNNSNQTSQLFEGIPTGTYEVYIIANYDATTTPFGSGSVTSNPAIASLVGTSMANFEFRLKAATNVKGNDNGATVNAEPSEIFLAKQTGVYVPDDGSTNSLTTPFKLTRAVSLVRVRIDQVHSNVNDVDNSMIDFKTADRTNFRIRVHGTGIKVADAAYNSTTNAFPAAPHGVIGTAQSANVLYSAKVFKDTFSGAGYNTDADMKLDPADYTLWSEYMTFPGGHATDNDQKFDIVLGGWAPAGYEAINPDTGAKVVLSAAQIVYWNGQVTKAVGPNQILELNLKLKSAGYTDVPTVKKRGNLDIDVDLEGWDPAVIFDQIDM